MMVGVMGTLVLTRASGGKGDGGSDVGVMVGVMGTLVLTRGSGGGGF